MRRLWLLSSALLLVSSLVMAQAVVPTTRLNNSSAGQTITIPMTGLTAQDAATVVLTNEGGQARTVQADKADDKAVTVTLPRDLAAGRYTVEVQVRGVKLAIPGELRVVAARPKISAVEPSTAYSSSFRSGQFKFDVVGENFVKDQTEVLAKSGNIVIIPCSTYKKLHQGESGPCVENDSGDPTHILHVSNVPRLGDYVGSAPISVRAGDLVSEETKDVTLSLIPKNFIFFTALVVWILIALLVAFIVKGVRGRRISGKSYGLLGAFVIDNETNTYSLSKLQLLMWSAVFVFSYIYLFLCQIMVQWKFQFPDVPPGLAGLLGISGGAAVAAVAVVGARGAKGSGPVHPSAADFITSGGSVVAERFQFFVWTIVGSLGFLAMLFIADPAKMAELPKIPDNFFNLMGISALTYLGGKAVRGGGPVVRSASVKKNGNDYEITVDGQNMENDAKLKLDGADLKANAVANVSQGDTAHPKWSTQLIITIGAASDEVKALAAGTQAHTIEIVNADGQSGSAQFASNPPEITSITGKAGAAVAHGPAQQTLEVNGKNFTKDMTAEWLPPLATAPTTLNKVDFKDEKTIEVEVTAADAGTGKLVLIPTLGPRVTGTVTVN